MEKAWKKVLKRYTKYMFSFAHLYKNCIIYEYNSIYCKSFTDNIVLDKLYGRPEKNQLPRTES